METMLSSKRIPLSKRENFKVDDSVIEMDLPIYGAKISPTVSSKGSFQGAPIEIVKISCGSGVTDYVTHESNFKYSTYGIHIGQDDRLTFLGVSQKVEVSLIDCRKDSPTVGTETTITMRVSPDRMIVIPRGVAHTLDGLDGVVTRDEPVWYSGETEDWHVDNDLVSFPNTAEEHPLVTVCDKPLPQSASLLISRMSQKVNTFTHAAYSARYRVSFKNGIKYMMVRPNWASKDSGRPNNDSLIGENRYAMTGPESFTIVPNTDSCTSDFLRIDLNQKELTWTRHPRSHRILTWLGGDSGNYGVEVFTAKGPQVFYAADPTIHVNIPPNTWYRLIGSGIAVLRSEQKRIAPDPNSKWVHDYETADTVDKSSTVPAEPVEESLYMPGMVANLLARKESEILASN